MDATALTITGTVPLPLGGDHGAGFPSLYTRTAEFVQSVAVVDRRQQWFRHEDVLSEGRYPELKAAFTACFRGVGPTVEISPGRIDDAIAFMEEIHPQPQDQVGRSPLRLRLIWVIRIIDPLTGEVLPGQSPEHFDETDYDDRTPLGTSAVELQLGNEPALSMRLCLPNVDDEHFVRIHSALQAHAPVRLPDANWRRWTRTESSEQPGDVEWNSVALRIDV